MMSRNEAGNTRRKRKPGEEVASNLDERIERAKRQEVERRDELAKQEGNSTGITDPRYRVPPLKNELQQRDP
jgi:hypothetical protein